eukprot:scaffold2047_cov129-Cylindrotheca_fusiformis.AAC.16
MDGEFGIHTNIRQSHFRNPIGIPCNMHFLRATRKGSLRLRQSQLQLCPGFGLGLSHQFSALATIDLDHRISQFTALNPYPEASKISGLNRNQRPQLLQVRFRRHDRASAFSKPRPKTRKQRQAYNRRMKKIDEFAARQSAPGSKAGPRRQWIKERKQQLLETGTENEILDLDSELEYGFEDALIEDIMGNTSYLTSQPTPEPVYLGDSYPKFYHNLVQQMEQYRQGVNEKATNGNEVLDVFSLPKLPSDKAISNLLRSYRDLKGTRSKPIGIVMALQHLLADIGVPTFAFGEHSYTSLLTCCRTPKEARRIFKLMRDHRHPISSYSWSILVDIHAKLGDYEGCAEVIKEMAHEGVAPTQAAYTSLLAACYKVCNDGRIPHSVRAEAGKVGWDHWQQMRIVGIEADSMAFGAIIRLCAARGQPERAINLLEEMHRFDVKPTTLCFSSALRAVARSHEIGTRFERGWSQKQLRRETFAAHHGKMAREIVIRAENAEVEFDDGFVSALMLCAAAAGDSATAKAVFLAAEVRKMDFLRSIGSESNLKQLAGPYNSRAVDAAERKVGIAGQDDLENVDGQVVTTNTPSESTVLKTFGEREYGTDSRAVSALIHSCAKAASSSGIGTIWAGKQNQGYLCENSLRLITTRWEPSYMNESMPGEDTTKLGLSQLRRYDEDERDEKPKPGKRKKFRGLYIDDDDGPMTLGDVEDYEEDDDHSDLAQLYSAEGVENANASETTSRSQKGNSEDSFEDSDHLSPASAVDDSVVFEQFFSGLKEEAKENGEEFDLTMDEAHELYMMMHDEFAQSLEDGNLDGIEEGTLQSVDDPLDEVQSMDEYKREQDGNKVELRLTQDNVLLAGAVSGDGNEEISTANRLTRDETSTNGDEGSKNASFLSPVEPLDRPSELLSHPILEEANLGDEGDQKLMHLQEALPGMPINRLKRVVSAFNSTLGYPSMLSLVPILRESMPDHLSLGRLKRMNMKTAEFAYTKAEQDGIVNTALLNSMLEVKAQSGSLGEALAFHSEQFSKHNAVSHS